ncbi:hypothetical protein [Streptomyces sp. NPDC004726]
MAKAPRTRKLALTAHVTVSVGWLGAVAVFLVLAVAGLTGDDAQLVRSVYLAMGLTGWYVITPLSLASLLTGFVCALGTGWGLLRHYWVLTKLCMTVPATLVLLVHMRPISRIADAAARAALSETALRGLRTQLVLQSGAALVVLLAVTALSVYKPAGRTRYGQRRQSKPAGPAASAPALS